MPDPVITNNKNYGAVLFGVEFGDDTLVSTTGVTYPAGTILGRITVSGNLTAYVSGAADGSQVPIAILHETTVLTAATPVPFRPIIAGRVRRTEISVYNAGTPLAPTQAEVDLLRDYAIIAQDSTGLTELDNQ